MDASADCPAIAQHPKQRSRISNHRDLLPNLMGTSSGARRFRDLVNSYIADLGGIDQVGAIKLDLIRRLAAIVVQCELLESADGAGSESRHFSTLHSGVDQRSHQLALRA